LLGILNMHEFGNFYIEFFMLLIPHTTAFVATDKVTTMLLRFALPAASVSKTSPG
jgi:hypothetical protein